LLKILEINVIEHFPQDPQCGMVQKVLPLTVIKAREAEALNKRIKSQYETEQQKLSRLKKRRDLYWSQKNSSKKELNYIENKRAKKRQQYEKNKETNRLNKRICYFRHSQRERDRQTQYSDYKWLYNKKYYEKKKLKSSLVKKNISSNILRKYNKFWSKNYIQMCNSVAITDIVKKLDIKDNIEK